MTGFGSANLPLVIHGKTLAMVHVECRSVNGRFLDLTIRTPEEARSCEAPIRELVTKKINRGKMEFRVYVHRDLASSDLTQSTQQPDPTEVAQRLNKNALIELTTLAALVREQAPSAAPLTTADILRWPGIVLEEAIDTQELQDTIMLAASQALDSLMQSRQVEGRALVQMILDRITSMEDIVQKLEPIIPKALEAYQEKLSEKLSMVLAGIDQQGRTLSKEEVADRIRQEVVLYGVKIDVAEEMTRLKTHFQAVRSALNKGGPVGKRLDFLMQELQRESNTLGSKSVTQETSDASMELKLLVEQIREQVQNLE